MLHNQLKEIIELLEKDNKIYEILKDCPYQILKEIEIKKYPTKEFYLEQGEIHDTFYIVVDGEVDIYIESEQGKKFYLNSYGKGYFIGELELFGRKPYVCSAEGKGEVKTLEVDRKLCMKWLQKDENFNEYVMKKLCEITYFSMQKIGENSLYTLKQRICQYIMDKVNEKGKNSFALDVDVVSDSMGVTKRSVNRVFKELRDKDIIDNVESKLIVKDYEKLLQEKNEK